MTHECMNTDGQMVSVERPFAWGVYYDADGRGPTLTRYDVFGTEEKARLEAVEIASDKGPDVEVKVVQVCAGEIATFGHWKVCGGREAVIPRRRQEPKPAGPVQFGKPPKPGDQS